MTDTTPPEEAADAASPEAQPNWRRDLEARAKAGDEAVAELATSKRRDAFRDAGLDPKDVGVQYFIKGYEGELTEEAIKAEAARAGFGQTAPEPTTPTPIEQQLEGESRFADAADDAGPVTDPELNDLIAQTKDAEELQALMESRGYQFGAAE